MADFNRRFTVEPAQAGSAFVPLVGVDLELLLSIQHRRSVNNDSTVAFERLSLQLPRTVERTHYVRCEVTVHEFPEGTLGISYQGRVLARYGRDGQLLSTAPHISRGRERVQNGTTRLLSPLAIVAPGASGRVGSKPLGQRARLRGKSAQRDGRPKTERSGRRPTRSSPQAGGGGVPQRALPAPPRPIPKGAAPRPLRSVRQRVENCSPPPQRQGRRAF